MDEKTILLTMQAMSWEKIKGELRGLLQIYWSGRDQKEFSKMSNSIEQFIKKMDGNLGNEE